ncbi:MAG: rRNA maturation RNase YbeY [Alphaproteobacteria bacterium]|nr:rRNA maturation RNase YbeY [Alphaproteobacteria bacterium]
MSAAPAAPARHGAPEAPPDPALEVDVLRDSADWPDWAEDVARRAAQAAYGAVHRDARPETAPPPAAVCVLLADDATLQRLNRDYRGIDKPTNVLSFENGDASSEGELAFVGDMALAWETVAREAEAQGKTARDHATHLVVHGMLHLMGMDHETEDDASRMEAWERAVLKKQFGIADPYAEETA